MGVNNNGERLGGAPRWVLGWLFDDEGDDAAFDVHLLDDGIAFQVAPDVLRFAGLCQDAFLVLVDTDHHNAPALAVDLDRDLDGVFLERILAVFRPGFIGQGAVVAQDLPHLFADMGTDAAEHLHEAFRVSFGACTGLVTRVHEYHHLADGGVEAEAFKV